MVYDSLCRFCRYHNNENTPNMANVDVLKVIPDTHSLVGLAEAALGTPKNDLNTNLGDTPFLSLGPTQENTAHSLDNASAKDIAKSTIGQHQNFPTIPAETWNELDFDRRIPHEAGMDVDEAGYPMWPNGNLTYRTSDSTKSLNALFNRSHWAWKAQDGTRGEDVEVKFSKKTCLGVMRCSIQGCSRLYKPLGEKVKRLAMKYFENLHPLTDLIIVLDACGLSARVHCLSGSNAMPRCEPILT